METWQEEIRRGNTCFDNKHWHVAEEAYLNAAAELEQAWFANLESTRLMMAWIANMHNLATLYEVTERPQIAGNYFMLPYRRIRILMQEVSLPQAFQQSLYHAMRSAMIPLLEFSKRQRICKCCRGELERMREWITQFPLQVMEAPDAGSLLTFGSQKNPSLKAPPNVTLH